MHLLIPQERVGEPLRLRIAEQFLDLRTDVKLRFAFVNGSDERHCGDVLHQRTEFHRLPSLLADITNDRQNQDGPCLAGTFPHRAEADLDGKLASVLAPAAQIQAGSHWPSMRF